MFVGVTGTNVDIDSANRVSTSDFFVYICLFLQNHLLDECQCKPIICVECKEQVILINLDKHKNEECVNRQKMMKVSQNLNDFFVKKVSFISKISIIKAIKCIFKL